MQGEMTTEKPIAVMQTNIFLYSYFFTATSVPKKYQDCSSVLPFILVAVQKLLLSEMKWDFRREVLLHLIGRKGTLPKAAGGAR